MKMSLEKFDRYCQSHYLEAVSFSTTNQEWDGSQEFFNAEVIFSEILVLEFRRMICLKGNCGSILLKQVCYVEDEQVAPGISVLHVVCNGQSGSCDSVTYTLVVACH